jgi:hypothetical protein
MQNVRKMSGRDDDEKAVSKEVALMHCENTNGTRYKPEILCWLAENVGLLRHGSNQCDN